MQLDHHLAQVQAQITASAALGDERTKEVAAALATATGSAVRLALLHAVTEVADEITAALLDYPGSPGVGVRLEGDEISVDVRATQLADQAEAVRRDDGDPSARISLRLSDALKADIDAAAERDGVSVNTWLVRAASSALAPSPFAGLGPDRNPGRGHQRHPNQRITGWING